MQKYKKKKEKKNCWKRKIIVDKEKELSMRRAQMLASIASWVQVQQAEIASAWVWFEFTPTPYAYPNH